MSDPTAVTPLRFNDEGDGWHLAPPRRFLQRGLAVTATVLTVVVAIDVARRGEAGLALGLGAVAIFAVAIGLERRSPRPARMHESPTAYGLLIPTHPVKISLIVTFLVGGVGLCVGPGVAVALGAGEDNRAGQVFGILICLVFGILFVAGAFGGIASWRTRQRGILLTVDGVTLHTQKPPASFAWHTCSGLRTHWTRIRSSRNSFTTPDDLIANWLSFVVDPDDVQGRVVQLVNARTQQPTVDVKALGLDPALALAVCRFYLTDAEARAELRTTAALDRVASLARSLEVPR